MISAKVFNNLILGFGFLQEEIFKPVFMAWFYIRKISFSGSRIKKHEINMDFGLESDFLSMDLDFET